MKVVWTDEAEINIQQIIDYIFNKFTKKEVDGFLEKVDKTVDNIINYPEIGLVYEKTIYRKILVSKQTYCFYRLENDKIILVAFFNNTQNPNKLLNILFS